MIHYVLILAAGKSVRIKNSKTPKQFLELDNLPLLMHSALAFRKADPKSKIYIALPQDFSSDWDIMCSKYNFNINHKIYFGGASRFESVWVGLNEIYNDIKIQENKKSEHFDVNNVEKNYLISVHDGARPFIDPEFIIGLIRSAKINYSAVPVIKLKNSLRKYKTEQKISSESRERTNYMLTQTPQVFLFSNLYNAYLRASQLINESHDHRFFDESSVIDYFKNYKPIKTVAGRQYNIKITNDLDYFLAPVLYKFFKESTCKQ